MDEAQLGLDFETVRLVKVTPNRLATWADCRRRYRMTYLDRPAPPRGGAWAHATLGAVVHLALRAWFGLAADRRTPEAAGRLVRSQWTSEGFRDGEQAAVYRERAVDWVTRYAAELESGAGEPIAVEHWVSARVGGLVVEGRVDRIDRRGEELVIVDYKTGRVPDRHAARESRALALYALAAERTFRTPCRRVELHHLPSGTVVSWRHDDLSLAAHVSAAERDAGRLAAATDDLGMGGDPATLFPVRTGPHCGSCDLRRSCPEGRVAAPERVSWALLAG